MTENKKQGPPKKIPRVRQAFRDNVFGVDLMFELHRPRYMDIPDELDPVFWFKNHPDSKKAFRKWYVFKNKQDFEKFFMAYQGTVPELKDWHDGYKLDWVLADDGGVCEIVMRGSMGKKNKVTPHYIRTIVGTFLPNRRNREKMPYYMDTDFKLHPDRSRFSGVKYYSFEDWLHKRRHITRDERIFSFNIAHSVDLMKAYRLCYPKDKGELKFVKRRALALLGAERIKKQVSKEIAEFLKEAGIDHKWAIDKTKAMIKKMEEAGDLRGAMEGVKTLAKPIGTFESPATNKLKGGFVGMLETYAGAIGMDDDVKELEEDMEVKPLKLKAKKDEPENIK